MTRLLMIDDDPRLRDIISRGLTAEGFDVAAAADGRSGLRQGLTGRYRLIILDLGLPDIGGVEVCRRLRRKGCTSGILMLTARDTLRDKVVGLTEGADDYLTKPFAFDELLARVNALLRRNRVDHPGAQQLTFGELTLDRATRRTYRAGREIILTAKEFALLERLMREPGVAVSRTELLKDVWNLTLDPGTKVVDVYVRYLRSKLDEPDAPSMIQTLRGFGYGIGLGDDEGGDGSA